MFFFFKGGRVSIDILLFIIIFFLGNLSSKEEKVDDTHRDISPEEGGELEQEENYESDGK